MNDKMIQNKIQQENVEAYRLTVERLQRYNDRAPAHMAKPIPTFEQWLEEYANATGELVSALYKFRSHEVRNTGRRFPQYLAAAA